VNDGDRRGDWEQRWQTQEGDRFVWNLESVPARLDALLTGGDFPAGAALDVGCGNGVVTTRLAQHLSPSIGLDIAFGAVVQARDKAVQERAGATFLVGDAARLPLRERSVALLFDRGCLQNLPRQHWPSYFGEVDRLLAPGGILQLFCSRAIKDFPPLLSKSGIKARQRWLRGRRPGPQFASQEFIRGLAPPSLGVEALEEAPIRMPNGNVRGEIYALFRKRQDRASP
jgi:SAM-dependent methyltransferase